MKTTAEADKESLQAGWFSSDVSKLRHEVELRAPDILPLIKHSKEWYGSRPFVGLPSLVGHVSQSLRLVMVHLTDDKVSVLMKKGGQSTSSVLPVVMCSSNSRSLSGQMQIDQVIKQVYMLECPCVLTLKILVYSKP